MAWLLSQHWYFWYALAGVIAAVVCVVRTRGYYSGIELLCVATGVAFWWPVVLVTEIAEATCS
jgi:hypothetical protein